jgi:hypothetical protein
MARYIDFCSAERRTDQTDDLSSAIHHFHSAVLQTVSNSGGIAQPLRSSIAGRPSGTDADDRPESITTQPSAWSLEYEPRYHRKIH